MTKMVIGIADCINDDSINLWKHLSSSVKKQNTILLSQQRQKLLSFLVLDSYL